MRHAALALVLVGLGCAGVDSSMSGDSQDAATADLYVRPPDLGNASADLLASTDGPKGGKSQGDNCAADDECASGLCRPLGDGGQKICVTACKAQADCPGGTFCSPSTVGSPTGYCIANSPFHCSSCKTDKQCGNLTERCLLSPGDIEAACHIDCALAGPDACPTDYECDTVQDGAQMRRLCLPQIRVCLDALGGFCDRNSLPQTCDRTNASGSCVGQRTCINNKRYDKCAAQAPQFKMSCATMDPAGCMLTYAPGVTATADNCGVCGNACPGLGLATDDVACTDPGKKQCGLTCRGENYDVDGNPANGCEQAHTTPPGHTQPTAADRGHKPCTDGASTDDYGNKLFSDARVHTNPGVASFNGTIGSAPDYWSVEADGGFFCVDDYSVTFTTSGGGDTTCYRCTIITNNRTDSVIVNGHGSASMSSGSGSYSDGTTIYFKIEKFCNLPVQESVAYSVHYHL